VRADDLYPLARARELLGRCSARGYDPAGWMKHDTAFASLRSRKAFQALLAQLEANVKPLRSSGFRFRGGERP
jgi:hypothetical protein